MVRYILMQKKFHEDDIDATQTNVIHPTQMISKAHTTKMIIKTNFTAAFGRPYFIEPFHREMLQNLLRSHSLSTEQRTLSELFLQAAGNESFLRVQYCQSDRPTQGRWYPCTVALQAMCLYPDIFVRLTSNLWTGFDVVNCHPTLLVQLCHKHAIDCRHMESYVNNRLQWLQSGEPHASRTDIKTAIIDIMNGDTSNLEGTSLERKSRAERVGTPDWLRLLADETRHIHKSLASLEEYKAYRGFRDVDSKVVRNLLFANEALVIHAMYRFLLEKKLIVDAQCVILCDKILVHTFDASRSKYGPNFLTDMSQAVRASTGFALHIKQTEAGC